MSANWQPNFADMDLSSDAAQSSKAWPFEEARKLLARIQQQGADKPVLFETGYGPSGLPHIGTFGEVARTSMVRVAFHLLTQNQIATRLVAFSDDMDGLRKVPDNVPNKDMLTDYLEKPLSRIPNPFPGNEESFAAHNNARLCSFLDGFGFDYEFMSATQTYRSGLFDDALLRMLEKYDEVMEIILPTLGAERRESYAPFLPISPTSGNVLQVPMIERNPKTGTVVYIDPDTGNKVETLVTGGAVKCQWKADWALRWFALEVDYEMAGKDLIESVRLSSRICKALGRRAPEGFNYELFLDERGEKISKSRGNGLTMEEWLAYASPESLSFFMYQKPKTAKRLYFDIIPKAVDDYYTFGSKFANEAIDAQLNNPVWHVHGGEVPEISIPVSFSMLLNLVSASNASDKAILWGFIGNYASEITPKNHPELDRLVEYAMRYYVDFVKPGKKFRLGDTREQAALEDLHKVLGALNEQADASEIQTAIFDVGKRHGFENLRDWFQALYQILLGQDQGPRFGSFVALYGIAATRKLIEEALAGRLVEENQN